MKKLFLLIVVVKMVVAIFSLCAKPVDEQTAKLTAKMFYQKATGFQSDAALSNINMVYKNTGIDSKTDAPQSGNMNTNYYVFNVGNNRGFVIVAGDDNATPILGYSTEGRYNPFNLPPNFKAWMAGYSRQLDYIIKNHIQADLSIKSKWSHILDDKKNDLVQASSVSPLLKSKWGQGNFYNNSCPWDNTNLLRAVTGCVATAMGQVLYYYGYPQRGTGSNTYNTANCGQVSADFNVEYRWSEMVNKPEQENSAIAELLFHCGASINMNYGALASGAVTTDAASALIEHFNYKSASYRVKSDYSEDVWLSYLRNELNEKRPVIYRGYDTDDTIGHAFVVDGYESSGDFHINWGWNGDCDGYFALYSLNPGTHEYNDNQKLVSCTPPNINKLKLTNASIKSYLFKEGLFGRNYDCIAYDITNYGTTGNYINIKTDVFDLNGNMVASTEDQTENLLAGQTVTHNSQIKIKNLPQSDSFYVYVYQKPWGSAPSFYEMIEKRIVLKTKLCELRSTLELSKELISFSSKTGFPKTTYSIKSVFVKNSQMRFGYNIVNRMPKQFRGSVEASLYNENGSLVRTIGQKDGYVLEQNATFSDGMKIPLDRPKNYLTFETTLNVKPGNYYIYLKHRNDYMAWELTGSTSEFTNGIKISVLNEDISNTNITGAATTQTESTERYSTNASYESNTLRWYAKKGTISGANDQASLNIKWNFPCTDTLMLIVTDNATGIKDTAYKIVTVNPKPVNLTASINKNCFFNGDKFDVNLAQSAPFNADNTYKVELSNSDGIFSNPTILASVKSTMSKLINAAIPDNLIPDGNIYKIRVTASSPATVSNELTITIKKYVRPEITGSLKACVNDVFTYTIANLTGNFELLVTKGKIVKDYDMNEFDVLWNDVGEGTIRLIQTTTNPDKIDTITLTVTVNPLPEKPQITSKTTTNGETFLESGAATSYQWYVDNKEIAGSKSRYIKAEKTGWYKVEVTNENGCSAMSDSIYVGNNGIYENAEDNDSVKVFPLPVSEILNVSFSVPGTSRVTLRLVNMLGITVNTISEQSATGTFEKQIDMHDVPDGKYLLVIEAGNETFFKNIVKY